MPESLVKTSLSGQYVTVKVLMPDGVHQLRQYSLTRADDGEHRHFSVNAPPNRASRQARCRPCSTTRSASVTC